ncbi:MAG: hypothetical protein AB3N63_18250 [Puniceicoccaceae bacterium]
MINRKNKCVQSLSCIKLITFSLLLWNVSVFQLFGYYTLDHVLQDVDTGESYWISEKINPNTFWEGLRLTEYPSGGGAAISVHEFENPVRAYFEGVFFVYESSTRTLYGYYPESREYRPVLQAAHDPFGSWINVSLNEHGILYQFNSIAGGVHAVTYEGETLPIPDREGGPYITHKHTEGYLFTTGEYHVPGQPYDAELVYLEANRVVRQVFHVSAHIDNIHLDRDKKAAFLFLTDGVLAEATTGVPIGIHGFADVIRSANYKTGIIVEGLTEGGIRRARLFNATWQEVQTIDLADAEQLAVDGRIRWVDENDVLHFRDPWLDPGDPIPYSNINLPMGENMPSISSDYRLHESRTGNAVWWMDGKNIIYMNEHEPYLPYKSLELPTPALCAEMAGDGSHTAIAGLVDGVLMRLNMETGHGRVLRSFPEPVSSIRPTQDFLLVNGHHLVDWDGNYIQFIEPQSLTLNANNTRPGNWVLSHGTYNWDGGKLVVENEYIEGFRWDSLNPSGSHGVDRFGDLFRIEDGNPIRLGSLDYEGNIEHIHWTSQHVLIRTSKHIRAHSLNDPADFSQLTISNPDELPEIIWWDPVFHTIKATYWERPDNWGIQYILWEGGNQ